LEKAAELLGPLAEADRPMGELTTYRVGARRPCSANRAPSPTCNECRVRSRQPRSRSWFSGKARICSCPTPAFPDCACGWPIGSPVSRSRRSRAGRWRGRLPGPRAEDRSGRFHRLGVGCRDTGLGRGAVRMNAGGHGAQTSEVLVDCRIVSLLDGVERLVVKSALDLSYRHSSIGPFEVVTEASYRLERGDASRPWPASTRSCVGVASTSPEAKTPARCSRTHRMTRRAPDRGGRTQGLAHGSAVVSDKHANFIQADPGGSADDVRRLIDACARLSSSASASSSKRAAIRGVREGS